MLSPTRTPDLEILPTADIRNLTGRARVDDQERELQVLGVPYRRAGRRLLVSRHHVREWLAGRAVVQSRGIDFGKVR